MKLADHFDHLLDLLEIELEADRKRFREEIQRLPLKERVRRGFTWSQVRVVKTGFMVGERAFVVLERRQGKRRDSSLKSGSPVRYYTTIPGVERPEVSGVIHWIKDTQMQVVLNGRQLPSWIDVVGQAIDLEFDENSYKEMRIALQRANNAKGRHKALTYILTGNQYPQVRPTGRFALFSPPQQKLNASEEAVSSAPSINAAQLAAIKQVEAAEDLAIIHGPPGTGKTTTLVATIYHICQSEAQVLVCAPSNVAVDVLAERLHQTGLRVVRTGHISRVNEELLDLTLDQQVSEHPEHKDIRKFKLEAAEMRRQASAHKRKFGQAERRERAHTFKMAGELDGYARMLEKRILGQVLDAAQVICCTLTGAAAEFLRDRKFKTLVVDEAAQALEPAMWIPLQRCKRVILAGDPFQLPPTVKSVKAAREGLNVTMMERLLQRFPDAATLLTVQYRMHAAIMGFSNSYFYGGKLIAAKRVAEQGLALIDEPAVRFIDTAGAGFEEKTNPETQSRYNSDEFLLITTYLYGFRDRFQLLTPEEDAAETKALPPWPSIALISPYREQVEQMRGEVAGDPLLSQLDIAVHTIDGFQGQERDWVLLSLVRSNAKGELGFLKDYRRMNVAMTRARQQLVVVADSATIGNDPFYSAFLDYVEQEGDYTSAFAYMKST